MELLQLKYFCHAATTENFSRTAKEFDVPQSNISQRIKQLEDELTVSLFTRKGNRVKLNENGRLFYHEISEALEQIENATNVLCGNATPGKLRIGIQMGRYRVMKALSNLQRSFPELDVITEYFSETSNLDDFDIVIANNLKESERYSKRLIFRDRIVLASANGLLPPDQPVTAEVLKGLSFITLHNKSLMYRDTLAICKQFGFKPRITLQSENSRFVLQCINMSFGVSLIPEKAWSWAFPPDYFETRSLGDFYRETYLYQRKRRRPNRFAEAFCSLLIEEYRTLEGEAQ